MGVTVGEGVGSGACVGAAVGSGVGVTVAVARGVGTGRAVAEALGCTTPTDTTTGVDVAQDPATSANRTTRVERVPMTQNTSVVSANVRTVVTPLRFLTVGQDYAVVSASCLMTPPQSPTHANVH